MSSSTNVQSSTSSASSFGTITVKKGQGLTHGLKDLVDKLSQEGKAEVGTIDWSKTIDKLGEIQKHRTEATTNSVFRGDTPPAGTGTNRDINWQKNMVVDKGNIEFSDDEMKELFEAMGVKLKSSPKEGSTENPANPSAEDAVDKNVKKESKIPGSEYKDGEEVTTNEEGLTVKKYTKYHEKSVETYNKDNMLIKDETYNLRGKLSSTTTYEYNAQNQKSKRSSYKADNTLDYTDTYEYNAQGKKIKEIGYSPDRKDFNYTATFEYDAQGKQTMYIATRPDGTLSEKIAHEYDSKGQEIKYISEIPDENYYKEESYEYDAQGNQIKSVTKDKTGVTEIKTYEYDSRKNLTKLTISDNAGIKEIETYEYDSKDKEIKSRVEKPMDNTYTEESHEYDSQGNEIKFTRRDENGKIEVMTVEYDAQNREIKRFYYDDKTLTEAFKYNPVTGNQSEFCKYDKGKLSEMTRYEYDSYGDIVKELSYKLDGKTLAGIIKNERNSDGKLIKQSNYKANGKTLTSVRHYEPNSGRNIDVYEYENGKLSYIVKFEHDSSGNEKRQLTYMPNGKTLWYVTSELSSSGIYLKRTVYKADGKTVDYSEKWDENQNKWIKLAK